MSAPIDIKETAEKMLMDIPGVYGVGLGRNSPEKINVYLKSECPKITCNIPEEIGGVKVNKIVTGKITSLAQMPQGQTVIDRVARERPYYGGMSVSTRTTTAGTLGIKCYDAITREPLILTNNHVGANESSIQAKTASEGEALLQPGVYDGGIYPDDKISELVRVIDFDREGENIVDACVHRPDNPDDFADTVLEIGNVTEIGEAVIGDTVRKSGRSSGLNESTIVDVSATIKVDYETMKGVTFKNQIVIVPAIGLGGDSGSAVIRKRDNKAVGLLFAGSDSITLANPMGAVATSLGIDLGVPYTPPPVIQEEKGSAWGTVAALALPFLVITGIKSTTKKEKGKRRRS